MKCLTPLAVVGVFLVGLTMGCGSKKTPDSPGGGNDAPPTKVDASAPKATVPVNEGVSPSSTPSPSHTTIEQLLGTMPKDKQPRPDGASARGDAKERLSQYMVGKSVEVAFRIEDLSIADAGDNTFNITPTITEKYVPRRPSRGIPIGVVKVGAYPCNLNVHGPDPTWPKIPAASLPKFEQLKGKVMRFHGKIEATNYDDAEGNQPALISLWLDELKPVGEVVPDRPAADPIEVATAKTLKSSPKPILASEVPAPAAGGTVIDKLVPADDFFPYRRVLAPLVNGQTDGEVRAFGPKRRLIVIETHKNGKRHGIQRTFFPSGKPFGMANFVDGKMHGETLNWDESGTLAYFSTWKNGIQDGPTGTYFGNGKPAVLSEMKNGKEEGVRNHYLPSGPLFGRTHWKAGEQVGEELLKEFRDNNPYNIDSPDNINRALRRSLILKTHWEPGLQQLPGPVGPRPKTGEWYSLFNGKDVAGWWPEMTSDGTPEKWSQWEVKDGILTGTGKGKIVHIVSDDDFLNFHLKAEVRIDEISNSGICFGIPYAHSSSVVQRGFEAQIAMSDKAMVTGGLSFKGRPLQRQHNPLHHKAGEWFTLEVIVKGGKIVVKVNGTATADEKYEQPDAGKPERGHIGLQVHSGTRQSTVEFRKVEVMPLPD